MSTGQALGKAVGRAAGKASRAAEKAAGRSTGALDATRRAGLLAGAVLLVVLGWLAWGWFRDSPLVQVRHVQVTGVSTRDAPQIRRALREAGLGMTTLHVRSGELRRVVEPYAEVRSLSVSTGFPSTLHISVDQRQAVAVLQSGKRRVAVAGDGTVLPRVANARLPMLPASPVPDNGRLTGRPRLLAIVLGGAPPRLRSLLDRVWAARDGIRVALREGPVIRFGPPARLAAKWAAATRLLATRAAIGANVVDVRLPERPAVSSLGAETGTSGAPDVPGAAAVQAEPQAVAPGAAAAAPSTDIPSGAEAGASPVTNPQPGP